MLAMPMKIKMQWKGKKATVTNGELSIDVKIKVSRFSNAFNVSGGLLELPNLFSKSIN